jgi:hypothetical protein
VGHSSCTCQAKRDDYAVIKKSAQGMLSGIKPKPKKKSKQAEEAGEGGDE